MPDENPYEAPKPLAERKPSRGNVAALVLLIFLSIPAAGIAFFAVCLCCVAVGDGNDSSINAGFLLGGLVAIAVLGGGILFAGRVYERSKRN